PRAAVGLDHSRGGGRTRRGRRLPPPLPSRRDGARAGLGRWAVLATAGPGTAGRFARRRPSLIPNAWVVGYDGSSDVTCAAVVWVLGSGSAQAGRNDATFFYQKI